jgi:hypothetical protein
LQAFAILYHDVIGVMFEKWCGSSSAVCYVGSGSLLAGVMCGVAAVSAGFACFLFLSCAAVFVGSDVDS